MRYILKEMKWLFVFVMPIYVWAQAPIEVTEVPVIAQDKFKKLYPKARDVYWAKFKDGSIEGGYTDTLTKTGYSSVFDMNNIEIEAITNYASLVGGADLPAKIGLSKEIFFTMLLYMKEKQIAFGDWVDVVTLKKDGKKVYRPYSKSGLPYAEFDGKGNFIRLLGYR